MRLDAGTYRLAIGSFDRGSGLERALDALIGSGFTDHQLLVAALRTNAPHLTMTSELTGTARMTAGAGLRVSAREVLSRFAIAVAAVHDARYAIVQGSIWERLGLFSPSPDLGSRSIRLALELGRDLARRLERDAAILGIGSMSAEQHGLGTRILLEHSSGKVETHEFTL